MAISNRYYLEGYDSYRAGMCISECPYYHNTWEAESWEEGWTSAYQERR